MISFDRFSVIGGAVAEPIKKTVSRVVRDRRISVCAKISLESLASEKEKLDLAIKGEKGCDTNTALVYNLSNLHVAISLLRCYVQASIDRKSGEMLEFNKEIIATLSLINAIQRLNKLNLSDNDNEGILHKFLELQDKLEAINCNNLIVELSNNDVSLQAYSLALFSQMRNLFSLLQVSRDTIFKDNQEFNEAYCQTSDLMVNEFRRLGTTSVDRLTQTARNVVNSFDSLATKSINILDKMNTYKEMYDLISMTAKGLQDGLAAN